jgi:hypothetical protein
MANPREPQLVVRGAWHGNRRSRDAERDRLRLRIATVAQPLHLPAQNVAETARRAARHAPGVHIAAA